MASELNQYFSEPINPHTEVGLVVEAEKAGALVATDRTSDSAAVTHTDRALGGVGVGLTSIQAIEIDNIDAGCSKSALKTRAYLLAKHQHGWTGLSTQSL